MYLRWFGVDSKTAVVEGAFFFLLGIVRELADRFFVTLLRASISECTHCLFFWLEIASDWLVGCVFVSALGYLGSDPAWCGL